MKKLQLLAFITLIFGSVVIENLAQIPSAGPCYSVETYPQADKRAEFAEFLKGARSLTDKTAQQVAAGQIDALYSANQAGFAWGDKAFANAEAFRQAFADMERKEGKVLEYEFRGQGLTVRGYPPKIDRMYSTSIYAVKTTKWKNGAFLDVRTTKIGPQQFVFLAWVEHFQRGDSMSETFGKNMSEVCEEW